MFITMTEASETVGAKTLMNEHTSLFCPTISYEDYNVYYIDGSKWNYPVQ